MAANDHFPRRPGAWCRTAWPQWRKVWPRWRTAWPCWLLLIFAGLAAARALPAGPERAVIAAPVLLSVPGALTLGALLPGRRPQGAWSGCLAAVLSMIWAAFASLALYLLHVLITAENTYVCLLLICAALAFAAQCRLILASPRTPAASAQDERETGAGLTAGLKTGLTAGQKAGLTAGYLLAAVAAGAVLLAGGTYAYLHAPHPTPTGYTWIAWSGKQVAGVIPVGASGMTMPFEIDYQQPDTAAFRLTAFWTGTGQPHSLATPVSFRIDPGKTMHGVLAIPPPPGGCTYRVVVTLTELGQAHPQSWSVNADVRNQARRQNACAS
jgi:hypothetical protein